LEVAAQRTGESLIQDFSFSSYWFLGMGASPNPVLRCIHSVLARVQTLQRRMIDMMMEKEDVEDQNPSSRQGPLRPSAGFSGCHCSREHDYELLAPLPWQCLLLFAVLQVQARQHEFFSR
jgi:hypothetical protein